MKRLAFLAAGLFLFAAAEGHAKSLTYCSEGSPEGFDPAASSAPATFDASSQAIYNRLVEYAPGTTELVPGLAERWEASPDGLQYTFHLRGGVQFHSSDGFSPSRPFDADDVVFSFERQMKKDDPFFGYAGGTWGYFNAMSMADLVAGVEKIDDGTVKFTLTRPDAAFLSDLAMDFASILSKEYADQLLKDGKPQLLGSAPVGTGPFQFAGYEKDAKLQLKANDSDWQGRPQLDELTFLVTADPAERVAKLKANICQVIADPDPADFADLRTGFEVLQMERPDIAYLAFNTTQKPFDDARVRKALNMAIDRQAIVDTVYTGDAKVATDPMPPKLWREETAPTDAAYDPEGARKLLAEAGVAGLQMKLWALPVPRSYNPDALKSAEMIKADFAKVGVTVTDILSPEPGAFFKGSAVKERDGAVLFGWTADSADPDNVLPLLLGCDTVGASNRSEWCDTSFQDLIVRAKTTLDPAERAKLYQQALAIVRDEAPWAPLAHSLQTVVSSKAVTGYKIDPLGRHRFDEVDVTE
jgi:dipeptide transport system substrate-binding protein